VQGQTRKQRGSGLGWSAKVAACLTRTRNAPPGWQRVERGKVFGVRSRPGTMMGGGASMTRLCRDLGEDLFACYYDRVFDEFKINTGQVLVGCHCSPLRSPTRSRTSATVSQRTCQSKKSAESSSSPADHRVWNMSDDIAYCASSSARSCSKSRSVAWSRAIWLSTTFSSAASAIAYCPVFLCVSILIVGQQPSDSLLQLPTTWN